MKISDIFKEKKKENNAVLSFEIFPPKKEEAYRNIDGILSRLCSLKPDFISITFGAGGTTADNKTVEIAKRLKKIYNIEPMVHITCMHYDKKEINDILKQLEKSEIENILALRGDRNPDYPIKNDLKYANELTEFIKSQGSFNISGGCYPEKHSEAPDMETDINNLKKKINAGANHLISQLFFDNRIFYLFNKKIRSAGITVPLDAGIMPVTNREQIERMANMCGAGIPEELRKILNQNKESLKDTGVEYTIRQIRDLLSNNVDGIHIYTMNNPVITEKICSQINEFL